jgi:hypothetical protein
MFGSREASCRFEVDVAIQLQQSFSSLQLQPPSHQHHNITIQVNSLFIYASSAAQRPIIK